MKFRLHYEGSKQQPYWGIAFCHQNDVPTALNINNKPTDINVQFFYGSTYKFGIRPGFWSRCHEFVDSQVQNASPVKDLFITTLGFDVNNNAQCEIDVDVVTFNSLLRIKKVKII